VSKSECRFDFILDDSFSGPEPPELSVINVESNSCEIAWTKSSGNIENYEIMTRFREFTYFVPKNCSNSENFSENSIVASSETNFWIENLLPGAEYEVQIIAENKAGSSYFSEPQICATQPGNTSLMTQSLTNLIEFVSGPSDEVINLKCRFYGGRAKITWSVPCRSKGPIEQFIIEITQREDNLRVFSSKIPFVPDKEEYEAEVDDLSVNVYYEVSVKAVNGLIEGKTHSIPMVFEVERKFELFRVKSHFKFSSTFNSANSG
jgi:Fibronectin type III domain